MPDLGYDDHADRSAGRPDDGDVLLLLDRAATRTPPLHLTHDSVVARGRQIRRHRRAGAAGMAVGALALAGATWLGLGGGGSVLGTQDISPRRR